MNIFWNPRYPAHVHQKWFQPIMGEIATKWQLIGIINLFFCKLFVGWIKDCRKRYFWNAGGAKYVKIECVLQQYIPKAIIIFTKRFSISICDRKVSLLMRRSKTSKSRFLKFTKSKECPRMKFELFQTTFIKTLEQDKSHFFYNGNLEMVKNIHFKMWIYLPFNI